MENKGLFTDAIEEYFRDTPFEKIMEDWNSLEEFDNIGPTVEDFINETNKLNDNEK